MWHPSDPDIHVTVRRRLVACVVSEVRECAEADGSIDVTEPTARQVACRRLAVRTRREMVPGLEWSVVVEDRANDPTHEVVYHDGSVESMCPDCIEDEHPILSHLARLESIPRLEPQIHRRVRKVGDHFVYVEFRWTVVRIKPDPQRAGCG